MTVHLYLAGEHQGAWYPEGDQVQVPRKGDTLWIETGTKFDRFKVIEVQWSFMNKTIGIGKARYISVEVHLKPWSTKPWWRRILDIHGGMK